MANSYQTYPWGMGNTYGTNPNGGAEWGSNAPRDDGSQPTDQQKTAGGWGGMSYAQWAQLALAAYQARENSKPGEWRQLPETPEQRALRAQMIRYTQPGGSPTRSMLGNMLAPRVENLGQGAPQGYKPINYDIKGILGGIDRATPEQNAQNPDNAPPPPPEIYRAGRGDRMGQAARGLIGYFGINGGNDKDVVRERETRAAYDQWLQTYGSMFTDASGKPMVPPKNIGEYSTWYQQRYGRPYQPPTPIGSGR
jgi:hypothetical protein